MMKQVIKKHFVWYTRKLQGDAVDSYSAQVGFFIIIAFIPFVLFLLSLLQSVNINGTSLLNSAISLFPSEVHSFLQYILIQHKEPITLLSIAALTCLWSSSKAMLALIKGLGAVFDVAETRNFIWLRIVSIGYTAVFALMLMVTAMLLVFGNTIYTALFGDSGFLKDLVQLKSVLGFIMLFIFFTFSYRVIPRKSRTRLINCAAGAAFASAGWVLFSFFFSIFVEKFGNYAGMYGSLASLVVLMLWLYFCMYILFLGGEVAVWLETSTIAKDLKALKKARK